MKHNGVKTYPDDGLPREKENNWTRVKHGVLVTSLDIFLGAMRKKYQRMIYVDLYSGPGLSGISKSSGLRAGSPFIALDRPTKFDRYIFCEKNPTDMEVLKTRIIANFPDQNPIYILGDCNEKIDDLENALGRAMDGSQDSTLSFCFVDPYALDVRYETLKGLATKCPKMDFMVNIMLGLDVRLNWRTYLEVQSFRIADFLGDPDWRGRLGTGVDPASLSRFVGKRFASKMSALGYIPSNPANDFLPFENSKSRIIYYIAFFSKAKIAFKFWDEAKYGGANASPFTRLDN